ncbi:MAG: RNA-binding protein [Clostridia bacterium]|nr:RNA-binding protein [Clostridia bacterium]
MKAPNHLPGGSDCVGYAVTSVAGRDKKRDFIIVGLCENEACDGMVYIADGRLHKLERPKKKKLMHLKVAGPAGEEILSRLKEGTATDSDIQTALQAAFGYKEYYGSKV